MLFSGCWGSGGMLGTSDGCDCCWESVCGVVWSIFDNDSVGCSDDFGGASGGWGGEGAAAWLSDSKGTDASCGRKILEMKFLNGFEMFINYFKD